MTRWSTLLTGVTLLFAAGCGPSVAQSEVGTPAQRYGGRALVVLPRACFTVRSVPQMHFAHRSLEVPAKTERLQAMLDQLTPGAPLPIGPRPEAECGPRPDLEHDQTYLTEIRATEQTLRAMRESGASHVVVLELHTEMACMQSRPWSPDDVCLEEEVTLTAWVFNEAGVAVWGLTRNVGPTDEPGWVLDRVLDRVPIADAIHRTRGEYQLANTATTRPTF